jgi:uncharacterized protein (TIGR02118 family)
MIKLVYCITRRSDVTAAEFHRYWLEEHGPKVARVAQAIRARRYVQSHSIGPGLNDALRTSRGLMIGYDGMTEIWWDSEAELAAGTETDEGRAAAAMLLEDEARFIDFARSTIFITREHEIF